MPETPLRARGHLGSYGSCAPYHLHRGARVSCIFCRVIAGEIPAAVVYRDDDVIAICDIEPQAPTHLLVMPIEHSADIAELEQSGAKALMERLISTAVRLGRESGGGFRLVVNTGAEAGQSVDHTHIHVLAGRFMDWPPG